jgi:putative PIN family toxin of toxin-antitoxin system
MRYKVFLDTNILLSGIFFEGNESRILAQVELDLITSEDVVDELASVVKKKLKYLKGRTFEIAITEMEKALTDISIIPRSRYKNKLRDAETLMTYKKDIPILAAVIFAKPDYFLTGDAHFFTDLIINSVNVLTAKEFLTKLKNS